MHRITKDQTKQYAMAIALGAVAFVLGMFSGISASDSPLGKLPTWDQVAISLLVVAVFHILMYMTVKRAGKDVRELITGPIASVFVLAFLTFLNLSSHK